jgi:hypothetical protein
VQSKTQKPVRFEISEGTRASVEKWMEDDLMVGSEYLWAGRFHERLHISTIQYARIVRDWVTSIGLEASAYGTHSMRRKKVTQIYKKTGNLRAVQLLLGHTKMDSTVRYLGVELEDALAIAEAIQIQRHGPSSPTAQSRTLAPPACIAAPPLRPSKCQPGDKAIARAVAGRATLRSIQPMTLLHAVSRSSSIMGAMPAQATAAMSAIE